MDLGTRLRFDELILHEVLLTTVTLVDGTQGQLIILSI